jgi:hypothetical protein
MKGVRSETVLRQQDDGERPASQAAEKLRMEGEKAKFGGCKTIDRPSRIVPAASWRDPFFAPFEKLSFSASCSGQGKKTAQK